MVEWAIMSVWVAIPRSAVPRREAVVPAPVHRMLGIRLADGHDGNALSRKCYRSLE